MKIGLLAYSSDTGLGYQTLEFAKNIKPAKILIADLSKLNGMPTHHERYSEFNTSITDGIPTNEECEWLVDGMDVVFVCETPLNYHLFNYARKKGVKTVQQYNYEFLDYFRNNALPTPSVLASPSLWGIERVKNMYLAPVVHWPVPVNTDLIPFREFNKVKTFVHIIGRPTASDRNGTIAFLSAVKKLGSYYNYKVYLQPPVESRAIEHFRPVKEVLDETRRIVPIELIENVPDNATMFASGEILVLPRKYGGLCLPMWEALSSGMPVIMPNVSPNDSILPKEWLVNAELTGHLQTHTLLDLYTVDPYALTEKMLEVAGDIELSNHASRDIAMAMSWEAQRPIYMKRFEEICNS